MAVVPCGGPLQASPRQLFIPNCPALKADFPGPCPCELPLPRAVNPHCSLTPFGRKAFCLGAYNLPGGDLFDIVIAIVIEP